MATATVEMHETVYERMARLGAEKKTTKKVTTLAAEQPTTALAVITKPTEDRLDTLTRTIREAHAECSQAMRTTLEAAHRAGSALIKARKDIGHGGWLKYVEQTCGLNRRTAARYVPIAKHWAQIGHVSNLREAIDAVMRFGLSPWSI